MVVIQEIVAALWQHDFAALANPHVVGVVYLVMFATLFLENGLLVVVKFFWTRRSDGRVMHRRATGRQG
ncbi:hypothetical protein ACUTHR_26705, partial [Klebsiella pneumoniae]